MIELDIPNADMIGALGFEATVDAAFTTTWQVDNVSATYLRECGN